MTVTVTAPGSKSITQRALLIAALAEGPSTVRGALDCGDSRRLSALLRALGAGVEWHGEDVLVTPRHPLIAPPGPIDCGDAGTVMRFGAALSLVVQGRLSLDGSPRLRERPIGPLAEALASLGVGVHHTGRRGFAPIELACARPSRRDVEVESSLSSQFASGLLLVAPRLPSGLRVYLAGPSMVSAPYIDMTVRMMERAGARVLRPDDRTLDVAPGAYRWPGDQVEVEPDWSAAALLLAAGRAAGVEVELPGLVPAGSSLQGDAVFSEMLSELDRPRPHTFDLSGCPDLLPPLAAAALLASHPSRIAGAAHARIKESDRIAVLARGFRAAGARVVEFGDGLEVLPLADRSYREVALDPAGDHRMAMAFAVVSLAIPGVSVLDRECVTKSFPGFWDAVAAIRDAAAATGG